MTKVVPRHVLGNEKHVFPVCAEIVRDLIRSHSRPVSTVSFEEALHRIDLLVLEFVFTRISFASDEAAFNSPPLVPYISTRSTS